MENDRLLFQPLIQLNDKMQNAGNGHQRVTSGYRYKGLYANFAQKIKK